MSEFLIRGRQALYRSDMLAAAWLAVLLGVALAAGVQGQDALLAPGMAMLNAWGAAQLLVRARVAPDGGLALALGMAVSAAFTAALGSALAPLGGLAWWLIPFAGVLARVSRGGRARGATWSRADLAGLSAAALALAAAVPSLRLPRLESLTSVASIHPDLHVLQALAVGTSLGGPGDSGVAAGLAYRYHWLAYAWAGWLQEQAGSAPFTTLLAVVPAASVLASATIAAWLASRALPTIRIAPWLAALGLAFGASLDHYSGALIYALSASHTVGAMWVLAALAAYVRAVDDHAERSVVLVPVLAAAAMAGKVSHGAVVIAGSLAALAWNLIQRRDVRGSAVATTAAVVAGAGTFLLLEAGQPGAGALSLVGSAEFLPWLLGVAGFGLARSLRLAGAGYALADGTMRKGSWGAWVVGSASAAVAVVLLTRSPNTTQEWFLESAGIVIVPFAAAGTAAWIATAWGGGVRKRAACIGLALLGAGAGLAYPAAIKVVAAGERPLVQGGVVLAGLAAGVLVALVTRTRSWRAALGWTAVLGLSLSLAVPMGRALAFPSPAGELRYDWAADPVLDRASESPAMMRGLIDAAGFLRRSAGERDVIAVTEPTTAWLAALSSLRSFGSFREQVESWSLPGAARELDRREALVQRAAERDASALEELCGEGVRWIVDAGSSRVPTAFDAVDPAFRSGGVTVWRICQ